MREIKFKAGYDNAVYDVTEIMWSDRTVYITRDGGNHEELVSLDNVQLMQFTGLHDKNGKEIYEGDIVRCSFFKKDDKLGDCETWAIVFPENTMEFVFTKDTGDLDVLSVRFDPRREERKQERATLQVIGNIYSNPELLK